MKRTSGHLYKRGQVYYLRWMVAGQVYNRSTGAHNKRDAENFRDKLMQKMQGATEVEILANVAAGIEGRRAELVALDEAENPPLTIDRAWVAYNAAPNRPDAGDRTLYMYGCQWNRFTAWLKKNHPEVVAMQDVTPDISGAFANWLKKNYSPGTFNKYIRFLHLMWKTLEKQIRLKGDAGNPWSERHITRQGLKGKTHARKELTIHQLRTILEQAEGDFKLLLALGVFTGLRLADCCTLAWGEVDLDRGIIKRVPRKVATRTDKKVKVGIPAYLSALLSQTPVAGRTGYVLPDMAEQYDRNNTVITNRVQKHFEQCGITTHSTRKYNSGRTVVDAGFHSLRHSYISLHAEAGTPQAVLKDLAGHGNIAMTEHYEHLRDETAILHAKSFPALDAMPEPAPGPTQAERVRRLVEGMTAKNWEKNRGELLKIV
ncbi:MAG: site-specific integrase [Spartobacteria bacterium]|nr:site-specific integrase [Spartobacteria bacterium]